MPSTWFGTVPGSGLTTVRGVTDAGAAGADGMPSIVAGSGLPDFRGASAGVTDGLLPSTTPSSGLTVGRGLGDAAAGVTDGMPSTKCGAAPGSGLTIIRGEGDAGA